MNKHDNPAWQRYAGQKIGEALGAMQSASERDPSGHLAAHGKLMTVQARPEPRPTPSPRTSRLDPQLEQLIGERVEKLVASNLQNIEQTVESAVAAALAKASGGSR